MRTARINSDSYLLLEKKNAAETGSKVLESSPDAKDCPESVED